MFRQWMMFGLMLGAALCGHAAWAQEKITLAFNPEPGVYVMVRDTMGNSTTTLAQLATPFSSQVRTVVTTELHLDKAATGGKRSVTLVYRHVMQESYKNGQVSERLDSDSVDPSLAPGELIEYAMIGLPVTVTLDTAGKIVDIQGLDAVFIAYKTNTKGKLALQDEKNLHHFASNRIAESLLPFQFLPAKPVAHGGSWKASMTYSAATLKHTCALAGVKDDLATVTARGAIKNDPKRPDIDLVFNSTVQMDTVTGIIKTASTTVKGTSVATSDLNTVIDDKTDVTITKGAYTASTAGKAAPEVKRASQQGASEKVSLAFNPEPGVYVMMQEVVTSTTVVMNGRSETAQIRAVVTMDMSFGPANSAGKRNMKLVYRRVQLEASSGGMVHRWYDSAKSKSITNSDRTYDALIGTTISATLDANGKPLDVKGLDDVIETKMRDILKESPMSEREQAEYKQCFRQEMIEESFGRYRVTPDKPVGRGDSWRTASTFSYPILSTIPLVQTCTLADVKDNVATVSVKATLTENGKPLTTVSKQGSSQMDMLITGTALVDITTGLTTSETMTHKGSMDVKTANGNKMKVTTNGTTKRTITKGAKTPKATK